MNIHVYNQTELEKAFVKATPGDTITLVVQHKDDYHLNARYAVETGAVRVQKGVPLRDTLQKENEAFASRSRFDG